MARRIAFSSLPIAFSTYLAAVCGFWALICARGWQAPPAGTLRTVLGIEWAVPLALGTHLALFGVLVILMTAGWIASYRAAAHASIRIAGVLTGSAVLGAPLLLLTGIYSDDVYLYHFYGRELAHYGANPLITPPSAFEGDPHLKWVYWKWLPSAYGPVWLMISAALSGAAGDSIAAAVVLYRTAGLVAHLAATAAIYGAMRSIRPAHAVAAAAFYAWNPFVLFESVASAHNDALVVALLCAIVAALARQRWALCGALLGCAVMVKPFALLAGFPLAGAIWASQGYGRRAKPLTLAAGAAATTMLAVYVPFDAGAALVRNIHANPAAGMYMNSLWELAAVRLGGWTGPNRSWIETAIFDPARIVLLASSILAGVVVGLRTCRVAPGVIVVWTGFCLTQAWIWPWYFMPIVAMAAFAERHAQRLAIALSLGGLLFYLAWPPPTQALGWIYTWRSLLLFGPALVVVLFECLSRSFWTSRRLARTTT